MCWDELEAEREMQGRPDEGQTVAALALVCAILGAVLLLWRVL